MLTKPRSVARDDPLQVIKFGSWSDSGCGSRITFLFSLTLYCHLWWIKVSVPTRWMGHFTCCSICRRPTVTKLGEIIENSKGTNPLPLDELFWMWINTDIRTQIGIFAAVACGFVSPLGHSLSCFECVRYLTQNYYFLLAVCLFRLADFVVFYYDLLASCVLPLLVRL